MPDPHIPGVFCGSNLLFWIDPGTMCPTRSPVPGPLREALSAVALFSSLNLVGNAAANPAVVSDAEFIGDVEGTPISEQDYEEAAQLLGCEVAAIKAVAEVESRGSGFDARKRPRILFERHVFSRFTKKKFDKEHSDISNPQARGYGNSAQQYPKLLRAIALDREAALKSASWGKFQILGKNHHAAGFATVEAFVKAMTRSEAAHLDAFVNFVSADAGMKKALRNKDWPGFARRYNGRGFKKFGYDDKIAAAYKKHAAPAVRQPQTELP